jgi:hypothetical protein
MTGALVAIAIVLIVIGGIAAIVVSYFRLQSHRADAVAMAAYRKLAEEAVAGQQQIHDRLDTLDQRLAAVERLLRDVG